MPKKFIITMDADTAKLLQEEGFQLIAQQGGKFTFLNQPPKNFTFEHFSKDKIFYTNILSFLTD